MPHYAVKLISNASLPPENQFKCLRSSTLCKLSTPVSWACDTGAIGYPTYRQWDTAISVSADWSKLRQTCSLSMFCWSRIWPESPAQSQTEIVAIFRDLYKTTTKTNNNKTLGRQTAGRQYFSDLLHWIGLIGDTVDTVRIFVSDRRLRSQQESRAIAAETARCRCNYYYRYRVCRLQAVCLATPVLEG